MDLALVGVLQNDPEFQKARQELPLKRWRCYREISYRQVLWLVRMFLVV